MTPITHTIETQNHGTVYFSIPAATSNSGYVFLSKTGKGRILCKGGQLYGDPVTATPETLARVCRGWHRQRLQFMQKYRIKTYDYAPPLCYKMKRWRKKKR